MKFNKFYAFGVLSAACFGAFVAAGNFAGIVLALPVAVAFMYQGFKGEQDE